MAAKLGLKIRAVSNVAASKTALIEVPRLGRIHAVILEHGYASGTNTIAAAATNIAGVRVNVNGRTQRKYGSGTELRDDNLLRGTAYDCVGVPNTAPGVSFPILFAEPWRMDEADQDRLAWEAREFDSFQIEVDLGAASTPTLVASVVYSPDRVQSPGVVTVDRISIPASGTSFDYNQLSNLDWLQAISLYMDSGGSNPTTQVDLRADGTLIRELTNSANKALLQNSGLTPAASGRTASIYDVVLDHDDVLNSALDTRNVKSTNLTIAAGSAMSGTIVALVRRLGKLL